jgi:hypothetical protein
VLLDDDGASFDRLRMRTGVHAKIIGMQNTNLSHPEPVEGRTTFVQSTPYF